MGTDTLKELHDQLLATKPEGSEHDIASCPLCQIETLDLNEGGVSMSELTQADVDAAVESAVEAATKPLQDQITTLTASKEEVEIQKRIDEATEPLQTQVTDLQSQLDVAVLEATTAKESLTNTVAYLEDMKTQEEALVSLAAAKTERLAKIAEVATFPEDFIAANGDRWAMLDQEDFDTLIDSFKHVSTASASGTVTRPTETKIPEGTAMTASSGTRSTNKGLDLLRQAQDEFVRGYDNRNVR